MTGFLTTAASLFTALAVRDIIILCAREYLQRKEDKAKQKLANDMKMQERRFQEWLNEFNPEEYAAEPQFALHVCSKCDKLRKNIIDEEGAHVCLECAVNGTK